MSLEQNSYAIHEKTYSNLEQQKELALYRNWFENNTTDIWRHKRMLSVLDPFLKNHKNAKWLTIGDGRFGTSAIYICKNGGDALASDIDISLLEVAKQNKMIPNFIYANAEKLPFADNQFDFSYCKMAYHHFPRPILAVYEMLRVSRNAIIFTEPNDFIPVPLIRKILQKIKHSIKLMVGKTIPHHDTGNYEPIGNYVYSISVRDFEKIALGLGLPCIAYKRFQDAYFEGVEYESWTTNAPLYKKIKKNILRYEIEKLFKISNLNNIQMIVFKNSPEQSILMDLKKAGYTISNMPKSPY